MKACCWVLICWNLWNDDDWLSVEILIWSTKRGDIECKATGLSSLRAKALNNLRSWTRHEILHVKRDWNQSADQLASEALHRQRGVESVPREGWPDLEAVNRLPELLVPQDQSPIAKIVAVTRSRSPIRVSGGMMQEDVIQRLRMERIRKAQEEESWILDLKTYLKGDLGGLSAESAQSCSKMARDY